MEYGKGTIEMLSYKARGPLSARAFALLIKKMFNKKPNRK